MLVCIPTDGQVGVGDRVHEHFGSASSFTLYDSETDEVKVVENRNAHHSHGTCHPINQLAHHKIDCVVCAGMGRRAVEALNAEGIRICLAAGKMVDDVINQVKRDELSDIDPAKACRGHGQKAARSGLGLSGGPSDGRGSGWGQCRGGGRHAKG